MTTRKWMKAGKMALLGIVGGMTLIPSVEASLFRVEDIAANCTASCVDTWSVACPNASTHSVRVRVRDTGGTIQNIAVLNLGQLPGGINNVYGQADLEWSAGVNFSPLAVVSRLGAGAGAMRTTAQIFVHSGAGLASSYVAEFSCHALNGAQNGNPSVALMQDQ